MSLQGPDPRERPGGDERPKVARGVLLRWGAPGVALVVVVAFGATVWSAYRSNDPTAPDFEPPLVRADSRPAKSRPEDPGGWQAPHQDKLVFETLLPGPPAPGAERLLPGPEQPLPKPAAPPEPAVAPQAETVVVVGETEAVPLPGQGGAAVPPPPSPGPQMLTEPDDEPAAPPPVPPPAAQPAPSPEPSPPPPVEQVAAAPARASSSAFRLQLAAFQDRTQVDAVWRRLQRAHPAVLGDLRPQVVVADLGAKGTWYRLQAAGLGSEAAARAACDLLKSHKQDCLVVKPG